MKRLFLFGALLGIAVGADPIVKHPRELRFPQRSYTPPRAADFRHTLGEVFLNASMASAFCLYALGRALICEKPSFLRAR